MNNYTNVYLSNMDEVIKDENKTLILLSSLLDEEYETFVLTLINGKSSLSYNNVSDTLMNHEVRRKDKASSSSSTATEALIAREISSSHWKGKGDVGKSKTNNRGKELVCFLYGRRILED